MQALCVLTSELHRPAAFELDLQQLARGSRWTILAFRVPHAANCSSGPSFDAAAITAPMRAKLDETWPAGHATHPCPRLWPHLRTCLYTGPSAWEESWNRHGRCTGLELPAYFGSALAVYARNAKYCGATSSCFFCVDATLEPIARADCDSPRPSPSPSPSPSPAARMLRLELERCAGSTFWSIHGLWPEWVRVCAHACTFSVRAVVLPPAVRHIMCVPMFVPMSGCRLLGPAARHHTFLHTCQHRCVRTSHVCTDSCTHIPLALFFFISIPHTPGSQLLGTAVRHDPDRC